MDSRNFRVFGPDETMSNRLSHIFEVTDREWNAERLDTDEFLSASGRVMDGMLSEHMCEVGWQGYHRPVVTDFSQAMRRSSALSTRWRHSTPSGSRSATVCRGVSRSRRST